MAELPRYKRPSSLITSGDVQTANISALVQAQQMQSQAISKGIDTVIQFALAKSERDLKTAKINAIHGMNSIMPKVREVIEDISFNIETNSEFKHEDYANAVKQVYGFVKPVYETNGEVGAQMYDEIRKLISPLSSSFTKKQIDRVKAITKVNVEESSKLIIKSFEKDFNDSNQNDQDVFNRMIEQKRIFFDYSSIELGDQAVTYQDNFNENFTNNLITLYSRFANSINFHQNSYITFTDRINNDDFGNRTELFKSLPLETQQKIRTKIIEDWFTEADNEARYNEISKKESAKYFYNTLYDFHRTKDEKAKNKLRKDLEPYVRSGNKEFVDIVIALDKEERTEEKDIAYIFFLDDMIQDPSGYNQQEALEKLRRNEITTDHYANIIKKRESLKNEDYKESLIKLKQATGIPEQGFQITIFETQSDKKAKKFYKATELFDEKINTFLKENPTGIPNYNVLLDEVFKEENLVGFLETLESNASNKNTTNSFPPLKKEKVYQ